MNHVEIYTDGACKGNPGPGGWGVLMRAGIHQRELHGGEPATPACALVTAGGAGAAAGLAAGQACGLVASLLGAVAAAGFEGCGGEVRG